MMKEEAAGGRRRRRARLNPSPGPPGDPRERGAGRGQTPPARARAHRLSRGPRPAARPGAAEEILSDKTPKRILRKQQLISSHSSPVNDSELQQDIYWDPHSPNAFKLDNGKKKSVAYQHVVEISDIVKRIAPKQSSEVPLNVWLGEDAIQCSPTVSFRERIKGSNSRFQRSTEEELMKLAKEFDRNMEQDVTYQEACEVNRTLNYEDLEPTLHTEQPNYDIAALEQIPGTGTTEPVKHAGDSPLPVLEIHCQNSSQTSLDLETEAAVNALFDGPTQHVSQPLSQGFPDDDASSPKLEGHHTDKAVTTSAQDNTEHGKGSNLVRVKEQMVSSLSSKQIHGPQALMPFELDPGKGPLFNNAASSEHEKGLACENITTDCELDQQNETNVQLKGKATLCTLETIPGDDGFNDWENDDWMEENSFVMQITHNPELIATPKESTHFPKQSSHTLDAANQNGANKFNDSTNPKATSGMVPSVSFIPQLQSPVCKPKETEMVAKTLQFEKGSERPKPRATFALQSKSSSKVTKQESLNRSQQSKVFKSVVNTLIKKEQRNSEVSKPQCGSQLFNVPLTESTYLPCTKPFNQQTLYSGIAQRTTKDSLVSNGCSVLAKLNSLDQLESGKPSNAGSQSRVGVTVQSAPPAFSADDWNDAEFYDQIQNMFSESDNLWETGDDDDDLNRICDDVEKLIQSQSSEVIITSETAGVKIANGNQNLKNSAILTSNMQKDQFTERFDRQQKHLNQNQSSLVSESHIFSKEQSAAKPNAVPSTRHRLKPTGLACTVSSAATLPTHSHHLNSVSNFQGKAFSNTASVCAVGLKKSVSMPGFGNGVGISNLHQASITANFGHSQKLCTSTVARSYTAPKSQGTAGIPRAPRFTFTKITDSSVIGVQGNTSGHVTQSTKTFGNRDHVKSPMERNAQSNKFPTATRYPATPLKRHFSDSTLQTKVVQKPVAKCSLQEIEQKKLAALARRKMKMQASYAHSSST